ncbi:MAG: hypothetical protein ACE366_18010 [Bradymonadia bacterium]
MSIKQLALCTALAAAFAGTASSTASAEPRSYPLPYTVRAVSNAPMASGFYLRMDAQQMSVPLSDFVSQSGKLDADAAMSNLFKGFVDRDAVAVGRWLDRRQMTGTAADAVNTYREAFNNFEGVRIERRVAVGDHVLFVWSVDKKNAEGKGRRWLRAFAVSQVGGRWKGELVTSNRALDLMILDALSAERMFPERFASQQAPQGSHSLSIATGVALEFTGVSLSYDATVESPPSDDPRLQMFSTLAGALRDGDMPGFAQYHDTESMKRLEHRIQNATEHMRGWMQFNGQGRHVLGLAGGAPDGPGELSVIFYAEGPQGPDAERLVRWSWFRRFPRAGWRPVNFMYFDTLDELLDKAAFPKTAPAFSTAFRGASRGVTR